MLCHSQTLSLTLWRFTAFLTSARAKIGFLLLLILFMSMPANSKIRVGIIGCGRVTETRHLPALRFLESVEVVALANISVDRLNKVADLFDIKARYVEYQLLLEEPSIDAVAVCVTGSVSCGDRFGGFGCWKAHPC